MTDFPSLLVADRGQPAHVIHIVRADSFQDWLAAQPERVRAAVAVAQFKAKPGEFALIPGNKADEWSSLLGVGDEAGPWDLAAAAMRLPEGYYRLPDGQPGAGALGWLLAQHRFDRYRKGDPLPQRVLLTSDPARIDDVISLARAIAMVRDMVDTPANDMGPAELQGAVEDVANRHGASTKTTRGDGLEQGFPMIAAVGRAAVPTRAARLVELEWGDPSRPRLAIVGKGVCFDTGGLDIKPSSGMRLMKKDMGGAAHALALADLIMGARLPVRLHLLIPAVENAIGGDALRPGDILLSRKGLTVEVANTDAEGRLILGDALTLACDSEPEVVIDFATLTGAARVALGPDLPALMTNDEALAVDLLAGGDAVGDPLWRLPLWPGYRDMLKSDVADLNNAPEGGFAGAITAGLFLEKFVADGRAWAHIDTFAWSPAAKPGRPKGGEALGLRATWAMLRKRYAPD